MKIAGLSIEGTRISVAIARSALGRTTVLSSYTVPLPPLEDDRPAALAELLAELAQRHAVTDAVVGLEPALFTHTIVPLPVAARDDVRHALGFEMEKYLPLPPEEYLTDFQVIRAAESGSENLVLSLRRDKVRWVLGAFRDAPVRLLGLRCTAFEVLREHLGGRRPSDMLFAFQGETSNAIITFSGGVPVELSLKSKGPETPEPGAELRAAFSRHDRLIISAGVEGSLTFKGGSITTLKTHCASALLSGRGPMFFEFLPAEMRQPKADYLPALNKALAAACALVFAMTTVVAYYKDSSALSAVRARLKEIKTTSSELVEIRRQIETIEKKKRFLDDFQARRNHPIHTLARLSAVLPSDAWVSSFTADEKGTVEIEGYAIRTANLIGPIERSKSFRQVELTSPITVQEGRERFSMRMQVEP